MPNWLHLPVGYHGRASSLVVSGTPVRPAPGPDAAGRRPSRRCSAPAACWTSSWRWASSSAGGNRLGEPIGVDEAGGRHLRPGAGQRLVGPGHPEVGVPAAGPVQRQELRHQHLALGGHPRGPGAVPLRRRPPQDPAAAALPAGGRPPHLRHQPGGGGARRRRRRRACGSAPATSATCTGPWPSSWPTTRSPAATWAPATCWPPAPSAGRTRAATARCWRSPGAAPSRSTCPAASERKFLADGDTVTMSGWCQGDGYRVGFGEVTGTIAARPRRAVSSAGRRHPLAAGDRRRSTRAQVTAFRREVNRRHGLDLADWDALWRWSVAHAPDFWSERVGLRRRGGRQGPGPVLADGDRMPGARWFPGARLNYAENLLQGDDAAEVLVFRGEAGPTVRLTRAELRAETARVAAGLAADGVGPGDAGGRLPAQPARDGDRHAGDRQPGRGLVQLLARLRQPGRAGPLRPDRTRRSCSPPTATATAAAATTAGPPSARLRGALPSLRRTVVVPFLAPDAPSPPAGAVGLGRLRHPGRAAGLHAGGLRPIPCSSCSPPAPRACPSAWCTRWAAPCCST